MAANKSAILTGHDDIDNGGFLMAPGVSKIILEEAI